MNLSGSHVLKWCVRVFLEVDARLARPELWITENPRLEVLTCARQLKLILSADDNDGNNQPRSAPDPGSLNSEAEEEAEDQWLQVLSNADTWYNNMNAVLSPVVLKYKIPTIPTMSDFIMVLDSWLGGAAHEQTVNSELMQEKDGLVDDKNRATAAEANVRFLDR